MTFVLNRYRTSELSFVSHISRSRKIDPTRCSDGNTNDVRVQFYIWCTI